MNNKGLSQVVTTVVFISLALIAIGIVWAVVSGVVEGEAENTGIQNQCLAVSLTIDRVACDADECDVQISRGAGGGEIDGLRVTLSNGISSESVDQLNSLDALGTTTVQVTSGTITDLTTVNNAKIAAYVVDSSGDITLCQASIKETTNIGSLSAAANPVTNLADGADCDVDTECTSGICHGTASVCTDLLADGGDCSAGADCQSDTCTDNVCVAAAGA